MDISDRTRGRHPPAGAARRALSSAWAVAAGAALLAGAAWLREPDIRYVVAGAVATAAALTAAVALRTRARRWAVASTSALAAFVIVAWLAQRDLARIDGDWPAYRAGLLRAGTQSLVAALDTTVPSLRDVARRALSAPSDPRRAFSELESLVGSRGERGVVVYRGGAPAAWAGRIYAPPESLATPLGAAFSPFYLTLQAEASDGAARAVATAVVHAEPPADRLTDAVDEGIAHRAGLQGFRFLPVADGARAEARPADALAYAPLGDTLFWIAPVAPLPRPAWFRVERRGQVAGGALLLAALILYGFTLLRRESSLLWRLVPVVVALGCLALVRLNVFSSRSPLFDPAVYFVPAGRAFTANIGALILAGATVLLGMFVVLRAHPRARSRWPALAVVLAIMGTGPFLLGALSRGISAPMGGITIGLWLAWEVGLFLAATTLLLGGASAGSALLGPSRGLPPPTAPLLAALAAAVAPAVLDAPAEWPEWYPALWIAAIGALALTRRHRALVLTAATVAALGATTLAWRADVAGRVTLANRDVADLTRENPKEDLSRLLAEIGRRLGSAPPPTSDVALLRTAVALELDQIGYPVALASWSPAGDSLGGLPLGPADVERRELEALIAASRATARPEVRLLPGRPGVYHALAVPFPGDTVTTVLAAPRTRAIADNPNNTLLGVSPREAGEPPYTLTLAPDDSAAVTEGARWRREDDQLHGHRVMSTGRGVQRAHILIDLRSFDALLQRGTLVVLFDLVLVLGLWALSVSPRGALQRWLRGRRRRWAQSYRLRLTVALFAFFVIPAAAFAAWSYQGLRASDRQSRELLVREALRTASAQAARRSDAPGAVADTGGLAFAPPAYEHAPGGRPELPLFVFRRGEMEASTEPVLAELAPAGRLLPPDVYEHLILEDEVEATSMQRIGNQQALFGYRSPLLAPRERTVLAAPATVSEQALDVRRRDLGVLVLFATVVGGFAALWLSGVAAHQLAEPIGRLRGAALAIAGGELEPRLPSRPPAEFVPVFSAFRRMARDLRESRAALEEAQRRTSAVLRNVASAVVAVDGDGAVLLANPRAESLLGRPMEPGVPVERVAPPELWERVRAFLSGSADEEEFDVSAGEQQLHGRLTRLSRGGAVLTLDDVTEMARAQRVLAWGEMARQVAHEIKNPLTPMRLGVQHLRRAYGDARADFDQILDRNVARILAEIDRLDQIARGFSRYGMAPAERQPPETVDVAAVARDVVALEHLGRDGVEWRLAGADAPAPAQARDDELREVLLNILENARHAAARRVEIRVSRDDGRVVIEVGDDGHGIPADLLPRIFEPHFSTRTSGSGLGLAISRQIIEGWGGAIAISSAEGNGTTVRIELKAT